MAHAERLCDRLAIIAGGKRRFEGTVAEARGTLPMRAHYVPHHDAEPGIAALLPADAVREARMAGPSPFPTTARIEYPEGADRCRPRHRRPVDRAARAARGVRPHRRRGCAGRRCPHAGARRMTGLGDTAARPRTVGNTRRLVRQTLTIARRDFIATVFTPTFLIFLFAPLIMGSFGAIGGLGAATVASGSDDKNRIVAIVSPAQAATMRSVDTRLRADLSRPRRTRRRNSSPRRPARTPPRQRARSCSGEGLRRRSAVLYGPLERPTDPVRSGKDSAPPTIWRRTRRTDVARRPYRRRGTAQPREQERGRARQGPRSAASTRPRSSWACSASSS